MAATFHAEGSNAQATSQATLSINAARGVVISAGDGVVVFGSWDRASVTTPTVTTTGGTGSETFTLIYGPFDNVASGAKYAAWLLQSAGTGRTGVDLTWSSSSPSVADGSCVSFSGLTNPVLDGSARANADNGGVSSALTSGNTSRLTSVDEFAIGFASTSGAIDSADAPWTDDGSITITASWVEHRILSSKTAIQSNFHGRNQWLSFALTFKSTTGLEVFLYDVSGSDVTLRDPTVPDARVVADAGTYTLTGSNASLTHGYFLTAAAGSYALTGTAAAVLHKWLVTAGAGSYSLTGTAASVKHGWVVSAGAGSYALTGTAASVKHGWVLAAGAASYALTGSSVTLSRTYLLSAGAGSYALTGTAASVKHGYVVAAGAGSYALTGTAASVLHGYVVAAGSGSYALSGSAVTLSRTYILAAGSGSYTLSGTSAAVNHGYVVAAGSGAYSLTGTAASLLHGYVVAAGAGSYALSGSAVTLSRTYVLSADAGAYSLTGSTASILHGWKLAAGAGSYSLTGADADLVIRSDKFVSAGAGSYAVTGTAASLLAARQVSATSGNYALTGSDAAITKSGGSQILVAASGSYLVTGSAATLLVSRLVAANSGSYALTGTAASIISSAVAAAATGYVNETVSRPRHERIGRPAPDLEPIIPPMFGIAESGQGDQSVTAHGEFLIKGASQSSVAEITFSVIANPISIKQWQSVKSEVRTKMTASVRASQVASSGYGETTAGMIAIMKSGGEALSVPSYAGEETPDPFFEARAA